MPRDLPEQATAELTEREEEILRLLATGTSNKEMAQKLFISSNTVKVHLRNIFSKIGAASRTEAAMFAIRSGLVESPAGEISASFPIPVDSEPRVPESPWSRRRLLRIGGVFILLISVMGLGFWMARQRQNLPVATTQPTQSQESRWHVLASLPTARSGLAVNAFENNIYAFGGETSQGVTGLAERYDPSTDQWTKLAPKPVPVTEARSAVLGGKIYVPGGKTQAGEVSDALDIYDPRQDRWESGPNLPVGLSAYALASFEGRLYLFGGWDGENYLDSVYVYRSESQSWSKAESMPTHRAFAGATVVGGKVYVVGGRNETGDLTVNEAFNLSLTGNDESSWEAEVSLPKPLGTIDLINVVDLVYAVAYSDNTNGIYVYHNGPNVDTSTWEFLPMYHVVGKGFGAVLVGSQLYVMGGALSTGPLSVNVAYDAIYTIVLPITK